MKPSRCCRQITPKKTVLRAMYYGEENPYYTPGWQVPTIACKNCEA